MLRPFSCQPSAHFRVGAANLMSAMGQKLTLLDVHPMSEADIYWRGLHVR